MSLLAACCLVAALAPSPLAAGRTMPQVTELEANNGPAAGGTVTVRGVNFMGSSPVTRVAFGGRPAARWRIDSDTEITAESPPGEGEVQVRVSNVRGEVSPAVPADRFAYDPPPSSPWLGLDGNNSTYLGPIDAFVDHGVIFDRGGPVEWQAGETLAQGGQGMAISIDAGMIPVVTIEYAGYEGCAWGSDCLPAGASAIDGYVNGFISSAREILDRYPAPGILFEVSNEPWGYGTASQYAAILARLLPAAERAGLPLDRIYAGATSGGWVQALYRAQPSLQSEIRGWYLHPYNGPRQQQTGIATVPATQAEMTSGQGNLIVSELGFCAPDVNDAADFCAHSPVPTSGSGEAAALLTRELGLAARYHHEGWLRALLVYSRNDRGWAMQLAGGRLTAQGEALMAFAGANG